ncbi:MAG: PAS domain-containing sensor histidine kinase [Desulfobacteraceae bacterium]|nr:MAG: PAS domain-containing sensor histidine kinase [Desulfobacteraceae bacterium]
MAVEISFLPIWIVDVGGAVLMIVLSFLCVRYALKLRRRDPQHIIWAYLLWVSLAIALFAVSRSLGHIVKQFLILGGRQAQWETLRPYSGAINTLTFMMFGAVTLFFERTWSLYQNIVQQRKALQVAHEKLIYLNQNLEHLVEERTRALALSEDKYRRIFEESRDLILMTRKDGMIIDINPAGRVMLGLPHTLVDLNFCDYFCKPGDCRMIMNSLARQGFVSSVEVDLKTGEGERKRVLLSGSMADGGNGPPAGMHFLVKDIDQQQLMREQMAQADKLASIGELSSGIAHEINNPLGIILGYTQLLLRKEDKDSPRAPDLKTIEKQVRHCKSIVEDLLNFARTSPPAKELCDIHAVIEEVLHFIRQHSKLDGIRIETDYDRRIKPLMIDEKKIKQVLINLLMNAQYAIGRQGTITIRTEMGCDAKRAILQVRDTGQGIEAKNLARIFDPFFTTKPTGQGTGLGLSVSYGIIKNHGGDIWVESKPGQGAAFTIALPIP